MIYDYEKKVIQVKVVYYGLAMSGKTTSLKYLFSYFEKQEMLESIDNSIGRTLFFDFGILNFQDADWSTKILLFAASGQDFYSSTRPVTLYGVDGLIFVVDSRLEYIQHNLRSWNEIKTVLGDQIYEIPIIISFNKYDLVKDFNFEKNKFLQAIELSRFSNISITKTIALKGIGVVEAFQDLIDFIFPQKVLSKEEAV
ncbi:MAG: ATP/GTP-binding protein [Promethearchaeota archaeon]